MLAQRERETILQGADSTSATLRVSLWRGIMPLMRG